jgi:hypothetical protein
MQELAVENTAEKDADEAKTQIAPETLLIKRKKNREQMV